VDTGFRRYDMERGGSDRFLMSDGGLIIRPSRVADVAAIAAIYGYHVLHGVASFEEVPPETSVIARRRGEIIAGGLPYLVAEREGRVVGYCYAGPFRPRIGYRFTLEDSIYIDAAEVGRGVGRRLLEALLVRCTELGYRQMVAVIGGRETVASIRLHERLGFTEIGAFTAVGFKFGRWIDTVLMQRALGPGAAALPSEIDRGEPQHG
jgi:L-amino acid N-acyltransferase YncA